MIQYKDWAPTPFDSKGAFLRGYDDEDDDRSLWWVAPVLRTRDSGPLDNSNFETVLKDLGGESDTVEVHNFGHWGPGWFEIILVHPSRESEVEDWERALEDYPVADEEDFSEREYDACLETWDFFSLADRVKLCQEWGVSVFAARRHDELPRDFRTEDLIGSY